MEITWAYLNTQSFIPEASFQKTARLLAKAALQSHIDWLKGLRENIALQMRFKFGGKTLTTLIVNMPQVSRELKSRSGYSTHSHKGKLQKRRNPTSILRWPQSQVRSSMRW